MKKCHSVLSFISKLGYQFSLPHLCHLPIDQTTQLVLYIVTDCHHPNEVYVDYNQINQLTSTAPLHVQLVLYVHCDCHQPVW